MGQNIKERAMNNLTPNELAVLTRNDLFAFIEQSFYELNPGIDFLSNWHIEKIASHLEACRSGEIKRLIICVPPRSLKSHCASIVFPAWLLGHNPSAQIICASYGQDLSNKLARDCRSLMTCDWYRRLFPTCRLSGHRQAISEFVTEAQGFRLATSVGGVLTGRGGDFIILDDPLKPEEAVSDTQRDAVNDWYEHTLISRLNNKQTGCIIIIMQRLHEDDLVGHVLKQGDWTVLRFPAIATEDEIHIIRTPYNIRTVHRRAGEALHPEREPLTALSKIRAIQGEYNFAGQYQQEPAPLGGGLVKTGWFKTYKVGEQPENFDLKFQSWDTAVTESDLSDYSVCTTWGKKGQYLFLLQSFRRRLEYPDLKRAVREQAETFKATTVLIENKSSGAQLIQDLVREGMHSVQKYDPGEMNKVMRLNSVTSIIENGFVYLPDQAPWLHDYLHEMATFPKGRYDDQCDSTSQALDWIKRGSGDGFVNYIMNESKKKQESAKRELCPKCQSQDISYIGPQKRCLNCGNQWGQNNTSFPLFPTRKQMLSGYRGYDGR
jgi:predicted phage terminase large subunit-like protein